MNDIVKVITIGKILAKKYNVSTHENSIILTSIVSHCSYIAPTTTITGPCLINPTCTDMKLYNKDFIGDIEEQKTITWLELRFE